MDMEKKLPFPCVGHGAELCILMHPEGRPSEVRAVILIYRKAKYIGVLCVLGELVVFR
jgi:hypothetical protein